MLVRDQETQQAHCTLYPTFMLLPKILRSIYPKELFGKGCSGRGLLVAACHKVYNAIKVTSNWCEPCLSLLLLSSFLLEYIRDLVTRSSTEN